MLIGNFGRALTSVGNITFISNVIFMKQKGILMKTCIAVLFAATAAVSLSAPAADAQGRDCPPGLANKATPCVPPGLAKKGVTAEQWSGRYRVGDRLETTEFVFLEEYLSGLAPLADGQRYAVIDGTVVALDADNYEILQLIRAFSAVAD